jgi:hypothetical protein
MIVQRDGDRVRLFTRNGHDWSDGYPSMVEAARQLRRKQFVIDGEAVVGVDGVSDFAVLFSRKHDEEARLDAFGMLVGDGQDIRPAVAQCLRLTSQGCLRGPPMASLLLTIGLARSVSIYSAPPAARASKGSCRSIEIGATEQDGRRTGSR